MVVRTDDAELINLLCSYATAGGSGPKDSPSISVMFGTLNLILCMTDEAYETWADGTADLMTRAPVTRTEAVQALATLRSQRGIR